MKKILLSATLSLLAIAANAQSPKFEWTNKMGGASHESGNAVTVDNAGNVYTTGNFRGTVTFEASLPVVIGSVGNNDVFITKHDASGGLLYAKAIGGLSDDLVRGIAVDKDENVYITGNFNQTCDFDPTSSGVTNLVSVGIADIFVAKYDASGFLVWAKRMGGGGSDQGFGIAIDKDGYVYTTGNFEGTADFDPGTGTANLTTVGSSDIFISKLDKDGNYEWAKSIGGTGPDGGVSIAVDKDGNVYTGGSFQSTADFDPSSSVSNLTSLGGNDIFLSKLNSMGLFQWAKRIGGSGYEYLENMGLDRWSNVVYTGWYESGADFDPGSATYNLTGSGKIVVSKLNSNGDFIWAKKLGSIGGDERSKAVAVDTFGCVYTVGEFGGTQDFDPGTGVANLIYTGGVDVFVSKLDSAGNYVWSVSFGGLTGDYGNGIAAAQDGSIYTTGYFTGTVDFNPAAAVFNLASSGGNDIFIHKLSQCIINNATTLSGGTISANLSGASYQWVNCPAYTNIAGATGQSFTPSVAGSYAVIISKGTSCSDTSDCISITPTGIIENHNKASIVLYPNPAANQLNIDQAVPGSILRISNLLGQVVFQTAIISTKEIIDINSLNNGLYYVETIKDGLLYNNQKLVISK